MGAQLSVFIADMTVSLSTDRPVHVTPSCLVRAVPPEKRAYPLASLATRIADPATHLCDANVEGFPQKVFTPHLYALPQAPEPTVCVQFRAFFGNARLPDVLLSHAVDYGRDRILRWPARPLRDFMVNGPPVTAIAGTYPIGATAKSPIFLDARRIGIPVPLCASYEGEANSPDADPAVIGGVRPLAEGYVRPLAEGYWPRIHAAPTDHDHSCTC